MSPNTSSDVLTIDHYVSGSIPPQIGPKLLNASLEVLRNTTMLVHATIESYFGDRTRQVDLTRDDNSRLCIDGSRAAYRWMVSSIGAPGYPAALCVVTKDNNEYLIAVHDVLKALGLDAFPVTLEPYFYSYPMFMDVREELPEPIVAPVSLGTFTIGHLLSGAARPTKARGAFLYIIRDGETVLYAGQTIIAVHKRINQHTKQASPLGQYFRDNIPASYGWLVEVLEVRYQYNLDQAERDLILDLRPKLNIHHNLGGEVME
jgi:hypothetical protein